MTRPHRTEIRRVFDPKAGPHGGHVNRETKVSVCQRCLMWTPADEARCEHCGGDRDPEGRGE